MNNVKRLNAIIWVGNVLLIVAIVAFSFQFLIFKEAPVRDIDPPISVPSGGQVIDPIDTQALGKLANPLVPKVKEGDDKVKETGPIRLLGTDSITDSPTDSTAFMELVNRKLNVNAYVGEPIRDESVGQEVPELTGWRLKSVTPKSALFDTPKGPVTLQLEEITAAAGGPTVVPLSGHGVPGAPWEASKYLSKKNTARTNENMELWDMDRKEVEWAAANVDAMLAGVSLEPYAGGGLKISTLPEGGFPYERGLRAGDVIKNVNGQPIENIQRLSEVMKGMSKNATTLTVMVDRSGRIYTLQYVVPRAPR